MGSIPCRTAVLLPRTKGFASMSNFSAAARRILKSLAVAIALSLLSANTSQAQCAPLQPGPSRLPVNDAPHQPLLPESGHLSNTTYTSDFFGFSLDLPIAARGHLIKLPLMPERQHALLAIAYQDGDRSGSLTIDAIEPREGLEGFSAKQQQQQLNARVPGTIQPGTQNEPQPKVGSPGALVAPQPQPGTPQFQFPSERFHSSERHKGEKHTVLYW